MKLRQLAHLVIGSLACCVRQHNAKYFRHLTLGSREFRCTRCEKRWVDVREEWVPWPFRGAHPYGEGEDSLGEKIAWRGANLREDRIDQTPSPTWERLRQDWLQRSGQTKPLPAADAAATPST